MKIFKFVHGPISSFYMVNDFGDVTITKDLLSGSRTIESALSEGDVMRLADKGTFIPFNLKADVALSEYRAENRKKRNVSLVILGLGVVVTTLSILAGWWS